MPIDCEIRYCRQEASWEPVQLFSGLTRCKYRPVTRRTDDTGFTWPSPTEAEILRFLMNGREAYGLGLVKASGGKLKRGTIYVTLTRMEEKGLVRSREEENATDYVGIRRRLYRVTGLGERALQALDVGHAVMNGELVPR